MTQSCQIGLSGIAVEAHDREEVWFPPPKDEDKFYTGHTDMQKSVAHPTKRDTTCVSDEYWTYAAAGVKLASSSTHTRLFSFDVFFNEVKMIRREGTKLFSLYVQGIGPILTPPQTSTRLFELIYYF